MRIIRHLAITACAAALTGCATQADLQDLQRDMEEMKSRLFQYEKELKGVRTETREGVDTTLKGVQQEIDALRKGQADLQATLDANKVELQVVSGKVDDLKGLTQKPLDQIAMLREEQDRRLIPLEERLKRVENGQDELERQIVDLKSVESEKSPEGLYQKGLEAFKEGNVKKARSLFTRFLELYPKHELASNARYWTGESYYSEKNYEQAILEFQEVIKNFPGKEKVPAALLKQGMAFREIGDDKSAKFVLKRLVEEYPTSEEAKRAKEKLKVLP